MDSPPVAGAFAFRITEGETTVMDVSARLFLRVDLATVGIAPGTSLFLFSDIDRARFDDFREAVHDSDGLPMLNGADEVPWRPLTNPRAVEVSAFGDTGLRGFGPMQRARGAGDYNDLVAHYERRPSLWVEPLGDWGPGAVMLVEIPTDKEIHDNIVAFWRPAAPLLAGQEYPLDYRLHWSATAPFQELVAPVAHARAGALVFEDGRIFSIGYAAHPAAGTDPAAVEVRVTSSAGEIASPLLQVNPATGGLRLDFPRKGAPPVAGVAGRVEARGAAGGRGLAEPPGDPVTFVARALGPTEIVAEPLAMPDQNLRAPFRDPDAPGLRSTRLTLVLRVLVLIVPLCVTPTLGWLSLGWFALDGRLTLAEMALVGVTSFAVFWVVLSVGTVVLGLFWRPAPPAEGLSVAILLPMQGEPAARAVGNALHLLASLSARGRHRFALQGCCRAPGRRRGAGASGGRYGPQAAPRACHRLLPPGAEHRLQVRQHPRLSSCGRPCP